MLEIVADLRWAGNHGIGRFSRRLLALIPHTALVVGGRPMQAVDPFRLSLALRGAPRGRLFLSPGYNAPFRTRIPYVLTVHDLNHIDRAENSSAAKRLYYAKVLRPCCRRAARVFTVSEYSRGRLIDWAGIAPDRVVNVGNGVGPEFSALGDVGPVAAPYFLCVSNRRPHKNEARVLSAFATARLPAEVRLVLTGSSTPELSRRIDAAGVAARVLFTGDVSDAALAALYRGALALVFPSLYEGFGLPVIEAMACGTPVVTSATTALPEIAGDAALLVDPESVDAIAAALERIREDGSARLALRDAGLRRAAAFDWAAVGDRARRALAEI